MFDSWALNNKINRIRERGLRTVYSDCKSSFLDKDGLFMIHQKRLKV